MQNLTTAIIETKAQISLQEWQQRIFECQQSGMSISAWCRENGISKGSYYFHLRKIRESVLQENQIVPVELPKPASSAGIRIESSGKTCSTEVLDNEEYIRFLDAKLDEELAEYHKDQNLEELADLLEVIRAAAIARGYTPEELERVRAEKAAERGGFEKRILLKEVFED